MELLKEDLEGNIRKAVFIEGNRDCYHPKQKENKTMTVGELISTLQDYPEDAKVFLRNDNGYTYGSISSYDIQEGSYDDDRVELGEF